MTQDAWITVMLWITLGAHGGVTLFVYQMRLPFGWIPTLNAVIGGGILIYWLWRWAAYRFPGFGLQSSDQWFALYGLTVILVSGAFLLGHSPGDWLHRLIFGLHVLLVLGALLFFMTFEMDRLF